MDILLRYPHIFRIRYTALWTTMTQVEIRDVTSARQYLRICIKLMVQGRCGSLSHIALIRELFAMNVTLILDICIKLHINTAI